VNAASQEVYNLFSVLAPSPNEIPEPGKAFAALQTRLHEQNRHEERAEAVYLPANVHFISAKKPQRRTRWLISAIAAVLIALLVLPNVGALANQFLSLFHVQQFQPVTINPQNLDYSLLSNLQDFGDIQVKYNDQTELQHMTQAQVERFLTFHLLLPSHLPTGAGHTPRFTLINGGFGTFTFSATKTRAYLAQSGHANIPVPSRLDGARFTVNIASGVIIDYPSICQQQSQKSSNNLPDLSSTGISSGKCAGWKPFYIGEIPSPVIQSAGKASLKDLRDFVLSLPGLSPETQALLKDVDLNSGTVPLPIPPEVHAQPVTTHGASGVLMVDSSMKLGAVLWQTHGIIYMIASTTGSGAELLDTANSLH
jgi:hypothetical protein